MTRDRISPVNLEFRFPLFLGELCELLFNDFPELFVRFEKSGISFSNDVQRDLGFITRAHLINRYFPAVSGDSIREQPHSRNDSMNLMLREMAECFSLRNIPNSSSLKILLVLAVVLTLLMHERPSRADGDDGVKGLTAQASHMAHPLLIRNDAGSILRVLIEVEPGVVAQTRSLEFRLNDTDDLGDLESLSLFSTSDKDSFSTITPVGETAVPSAKIAFPCDQPLREGKNYFWLACRLKETANQGHRIAATCPLVETDLGRVTPRDSQPDARHRIGVALRRHNDDGVHTYRIPAMTRSPKGTLFVVYDMRRQMGRDLQEDIDIGLSRSTDGGRTWEPAKVIMDMGEYGELPQSQNGCSDPGIIVDPATGEIFCFALWMNGKPGKHQWTDDGSEPGFEIGKSAQLMLVLSKDDGLTWSEPQNLTRTLKRLEWWLLAPAPQSGISLPDGTLVMPIQGRTGREPLETFATIMTSRDHGATWTIGQPGYTGGNECQAAMLGDGSIMLNIRNDRERYRAVVVTKDLGQTWTPHATHRNTLIEPNCNGSLLRVDYEQAGQPKHVLLFANPHTQKGRTHQTLQVSFDDGLTWPASHHLLLDEGAGAGYPSLTRIDANHIGIVYEGSQSNLMFERLALADLLVPIRRTPLPTPENK